MSCPPSPNSENQGYKGAQPRTEQIIPPCTQTTRKQQNFGFILSVFEQRAYLDMESGRPFPFPFPLPLFLLLTFFVSAQADFHKDFDISWGRDRVRVLENGKKLQLSLDRASGSGFQSKQEYLFAKIDMQIKLVPGNSAGTVTAYYLSSQGPKHDEIDMEFLGNVSGEPYVMQTNIISQGVGNREQQIYLWFDPTKNFHTYSFQWTAQQIMFSVDGTPVRVFKNNEGLGVPYPNKQPMRVSSSLWDAQDWATRGGLVKTDWSEAPFLASFRNFKVQTSSSSISQQAQSLALDSEKQQKLDWVRKKFLIYDYCTDAQRFPNGYPPECTLGART